MKFIVEESEENIFMMFFTEGFEGGDDVGWEEVEGFGAVLGENSVHFIKFG